MAGKVVAGRKTEEAAAGCSVGEKAGDAALVGGVTEKEKIAADAAGDGKIYVMSQEQVDYILAWDLEEDTFHRCDDDSDAWKKGCDFFRKSELELLQYQKKVREEYETYGFVRVEYDEEEEERMSETHRAACLKAFGPDFHLDSSDSEDEGRCDFWEEVIAEDA
jgi:hypothetical protein